MKEERYAEIYLWNRSVDRLIRILQRMQTLSILPRQKMKAYEVRLEEIRAALNADFTEATATRERADQWRLTDSELRGKNRIRNQN